MGLHKEIAAAWGTSPAYVYKQAKKGCPIDSVEAAVEWRHANSKLGVGYRSKTAPGTPPESGESVAEAVEDGGEQGSTAGSHTGAGGEGSKERKIRLKSVEASLKNSIAVEEQAAAAVKRVEEKAKKDPRFLDQMVTAVNVYNKAQAGRMDAEKRVQELQEERRQLIRVEHATEIIQRAWGPLLARLRSAPKRAAPKANPENDVLAEEVFREEIEQAIAEGQIAYADAFAA